MKIDETLLDHRPWHPMPYNSYVTRSSNDCRFTVSSVVVSGFCILRSVFMKAPPIGAQTRKTRPKKDNFAKGHSPKKKSGFVVVCQELSLSLSLAGGYWSSPATDPARSSSTVKHSSKNQPPCDGEVVKRGCRKKGKKYNRQRFVLVLRPNVLVHTSHFTFSVRHKSNFCLYYVEGVARARRDWRFHPFLNDCDFLAVFVSCCGFVILRLLSSSTTTTPCTVNAKPAECLRCSAESGCSYVLQRSFCLRCAACCR